jgi:homoserine O-succinyltransferase
MPVHLVEDASHHELLARVNRNTNAGPDASRCIQIGLINNMPDGALKATERQFQTLLDSAANGAVVRLSLYTLPEVPRSESGRRHLSRYFSIESLWNSHLDGLIVTGTEPRAANLMDEPYWGSLTKLCEWAEHNTHSTIWSCLATHAAVLHFDGIDRRRLSEKRFGVFEYARALDHPLTAGVASPLRMPHSRWNDVPENELTDCGYRVLARAKDGHVDAFVKQRKSLCIFFQGHPEYEANTLLLEYRRDVGRYLRGERDTYPPMPENYFDRDTTDVLTKLQVRTLSNRHKDLLTEFPTELLEKRLNNTWRSEAALVFRNWLAYLREQKGCRLPRFSVKKERAYSVVECSAPRTFNG